MAKHSKFFNILQKIAEAQEPVGRSRLAALLVYKNEVLAVGYNRHKSHPFQRKYAYHEDAIYLHAETDLIRNALRTVSLDVIQKSTMYVYRAKRPDDNHDIFIQGMAKPCEGCQKCIAQFGIKKVFYSVNEEGFDFL